MHGTRKQNCSVKRVSVTSCRVCQLLHSEALRQSKSLFQFMLLNHISVSYIVSFFPVVVAADVVVVVFIS